MNLIGIVTANYRNDFLTYKWLSERPVVAQIQLLQICEFLFSLLDTIVFGGKDCLWIHFDFLIIGFCLQVVIEKKLWLADIKKWEKGISYYLANLWLSFEMMFISKTTDDQEALFTFIMLCFTRIHE